MVLPSIMDDLDTIPVKAFYDRSVLLYIYKFVNFFLRV